MEVKVSKLGIQGLKNYRPMGLWDSGSVELNNY